MNQLNLVRLTSAGRWLFALSIIGMATQQLIYQEFRNLFIPQTPDWMSPLWLWVYSLSFYLIGSCGMILLKKNWKAPAMLGVVLIVLFLIGHVPYRFTQTPFNLGVWTIAIKCLAFAGGAFIGAGALREVTREEQPGAKESSVGKLIRIGTIFFLSCSWHSEQITSYIQSACQDWFPNGSPEAFSGHTLPASP